MDWTVYGGMLGGGLTLEINGNLPVTEQDYFANIKSAAALDLPKIRKARAVTAWVPLAVVGGGPSAKDHLETLKTWPGQIWAINGAYHWCALNGIDSTFIAIDPHPIVERWAVGVKRAIVGNTCTPKVFDILKDAEVRVFDLGPDDFKGTSSTATVIPFLAPMMGHAPVMFFGCESSFVQESHGYQHEGRNDLLLIECGEGAYLTYSDFFRQAQELSAFIRQHPDIFKEESGGLLRAMVKHEKFRIRWVSDEIVHSMGMKKQADRQELIESILNAIPIYGHRRIDADSLEALMLRSEVRETLDKMLPR